MTRLLKTIFTLALIIVIPFGFVACGGLTESEKDKDVGYFLNLDSAVVSARVFRTANEWISTAAYELELSNLHAEVNVDKVFIDSHMNTVFSKSYAQIFDDRAEVYNTIDSSPEYDGKSIYYKNYEEYDDVLNGSVVPVTVNRALLRTYNSFGIEKDLTKIKFKKTKSKTADFYTFTTNNKDEIAKLIFNNPAVLIKQVNVLATITEGSCYIIMEQVFESNKWVGLITINEGSTLVGNPIEKDVWNETIFGTPPECTELHTVTFLFMGAVHDGDITLSPVEHSRIEVNCGSTIEAPMDLVREGYIISAWAIGTIEQAEPTLWNFDTDKVTQDIVLHPMWVALLI